MTQQFEVYAIRLASTERPTRDNFLNDPGRAGTMTMDFNMWLVRSPDRILAVDTGFDEEAGRRRNRYLDRRPQDAVRELGIDPAEVTDLVLTHLHYDHAGNIGDFPNATIWVQEKELAYTAGPSMRHLTLNHFFEVEDICAVLRKTYAGRVRVIDGVHRMTDGLELHLVGGHTPGLQMVRVWTSRGWVVLASDALHYVDNFQLSNPFPGIVNVPDMMDGYERILELAHSTDHIIPGHDPCIMQRYYCAAADLPEDIVALHKLPNT